MELLTSLLLVLGFLISRLGNWDPPVPRIKFWLTILPVFLTSIVYSLKKDVIK